MMQTVGTLVDKHVLKFTETTSLPESSSQLQTTTPQERTEEGGVKNYASLVMVMVYWKIFMMHEEVMEGDYYGAGIFFCYIIELVGKVHFRGLQTSCPDLSFANST